ncbi:transcriptional regulator, AraC family, partial [Elysia marginata]
MSEISNDAVRALINYLGILGVDRQSCFAVLGNTEETFNKTELIDTRHYQALYQFGQQQLNQSNLGFIFGQHIEADRWGVLGNIAFTSNTLHEVLLNQQKYQSIVGSIGTPVYRVSDGYLNLKWLPAGTYCHHIADEVITSWVALARKLTGQVLRPQHIYFSHSIDPQDLAIYEAYFSCPVSFEAGFNGLTITADVMSLACHRANPSLNRILKQYAEQVLQFRSKQDLVKLAQAFIRNNLAQGRPSLADLARHMSLSERTLQRQLQRHGESFTSLLDRCRKNQACNYLVYTNFKTHEISELLDFSEPSAFIRAFRQWQDMTPGEYRSQH